jgi:hypothetical protein
MSVADKYARPQITQLDQGTMRQIQDAGQVLHANGVRQSEALGTPAPVAKYARPDTNQVMKSQQVQGERSHALTPDSNLGQKKQGPSHSL